jgi:hypothetical protein
MQACCWGSAQWVLRNAPEKALRTSIAAQIGGAQWQTFPTERGAQTPRNALKLFMKNQGAHWSRVSTVFCCKPHDCKTA